MSNKTAPQPPRISVIIVNYNGGEYIDDCITSVLRSTHPRLEVVVVDNGSTDGSAELVKARSMSDDRLNLIALDENLGSARGNNIGIQYARGEYVALLNLDTKVDPQWLTELSAALDEDETIALAQAKLMLMSDPQRIDSVGIHINQLGLVHDVGSGHIDRGQFDGLTDIFAAKGAAVLARKTVLREVAGFDPLFFIYFMDADLCWRMRLAGYRIVLVPGAVVFHAGGGSSTAQLMPLLVFDSTKNHIISWIKNFGWARLVRSIPLSFVLVVGAAMRDIVVRGRTDHGIARLRSVIWVLRNLSAVWGHRKRIQGSRRVPDSVLFGQTKLGLRAGMALRRQTK